MPLNCNPFIETRMFKNLLVTFLFALLCSLPVMAELRLSVSHQGLGKVGLYDKYHAEFISSGEDFHNPFDSQEIELNALFSSPNGAAISLPMFFLQAHDTNVRWGLNFSPRQLGIYSYVVQMKHQGKVYLSAPIKFVSIPSNKTGFLHQDDNQGSWVFDSGERFRGVGLNIAWEARLSIGDDPKHDYAYLLSKMKENKINLVRTWINVPWNIPLEWQQPNFGRYKAYNGIGLHPQAIARFDYLINHAEKNQVNLMLTMDYHGSLWSKDFDKWGNDHWKNHAYNVKNGGPAATPAEFFTHPKAISRYQDRLRYIIARWGYSTRIAAIEFWNEIDNAVFKEGQNIPEQAVSQWHQTMSDYLTQIDPYQHIQTTSISHHEIDGLFDIAGLDFTQSHLYGRTSIEMEQFVENFSTRYKKGYVVGETAIGWDGVNNRIEEYALALHENLWVLMFNKTPILPMTWWWEAYDKNNKFFHLKHAANFIFELTGTDDLYSNHNQVSVSNGAMHRALYNGSSQYVWVKNTTKQSKDIKITITSSSGNLLTGSYKIALFDTWTGKTTQLSPISANVKQDNSAVISVEIKELAGERDKVVILTK